MISSAIFLNVSCLRNCLSGGDMVNSSSSCDRWSWIIVINGRCDVCELHQLCPAGYRNCVSIRKTVIGNIFALPFHRCFSTTTATPPTVVVIKQSQRMQAGIMQTKQVVRQAFKGKHIFPDHPWTPELGNGLRRRNSPSEFERFQILHYNCVQLLTNISTVSNIVNLYYIKW